MDGPGTDMKFDGFGNVLVGNKVEGLGDSVRDRSSGGQAFDRRSLYLLLLS